MKKKILRFFHDKRGSSGGTYTFAFIILFISLLVFAFYSKYSSILVLENRVEETMKEACLYVMTSHWDELYSSVKEGYAGAYNFKGEELIDPDRVYDIMQRELETDRVGDTYVKYNSDGEILYKYYDIEMVINNTGFRNIDDTFSVDLKITLEIPFTLLHIYKPMAFELKSHASWTAKY